MTGSITPCSLMLAMKSVVRAASLRGTVELAVDPVRWLHQPETSQLAPAGARPEERNAGMARVIPAAVPLPG